MGGIRKIQWFVDMEEERFLQGNNYMFLNRTNSSKASDFSRRHSKYTTTVPKRMAKERT